MGYCINLIGGTAKLPAANHAEAWKRLERLDRTGVKHGGQWNKEGQVASWFSWTDPNWLANADGDVRAALAEWRFHFEPDENGDLVIDYFSGEKIGDEDQLFDALSDLMTGYLEFMGEDGNHWRVHFGEPKTRHTYAGFSEDR